MALSDEEKIETLAKQQKKLADQIRKIKAKGGEKLRKHETTAKILFGQNVLKAVKANDHKANELYQEHRKQLTDRDKKRLDEALEVIVPEFGKQTEIPMTQQTEPA